MAARIVEDFWTCGKRWELEGFLFDKGHRFPKRPCGMPMSGAEHVALLFDWLDERDSTTGDLSGVEPSALELRARWSGKAGLLWAALVAVGWIDVDKRGTRWHDYYALNGKVIEERLKKRRLRGQPPGTDTRDNTPGQDPGQIEVVPPKMGGQDPHVLGSGPSQRGTSGSAGALGAPRTDAERPPAADPNPPGTPGRSKPDWRVQRILDARKRAAEGKPVEPAPPPPTATAAGGSAACVRPVWSPGATCRRPRAAPLACPTDEDA